MLLSMPAEVMSAEFIATLEELDRREDSDHTVELLYSRIRSTIYIRVTEKALKRVKFCIVPNTEARHAFLYPFCYIG